VDLGVGALGISSNIHSTFLNITSGFCHATNWRNLLSVAMCFDASLLLCSVLNFSDPWRWW
jgi:hypothetical protein